VQILEERTGAPCLGVFPYLDDLRLDAEDSLSLDVRPRSAVPSGASVAIVRFPRVSNTTDFRLLTWADWITAPPARDYDHVILPGSKNTIADLQWLHERGLAGWIAGQRERGAQIIGVCGGFQMLGRMIHDPGGVESAAGSAEGLGLLPAETVLTSDKTTRVVCGTTPGGVHFSGYEIHLGVTSIADPVEPFARLDDGTAEGVRTPGIIGTYLHGVFEHAAVCGEVLGTPVTAAPKDIEYQRLAEWFDRHSRNLDALAL
jgi:adenosylcobyric acid synthase